MFSKGKSAKEPVKAGDISLTNIAYIKDDNNAAKTNHGNSDNKDGDDELKSKDLGTGNSLAGGSGIPLSSQRTGYPVGKQSGDQGVEPPSYSEVQRASNTTTAAVHMHSSQPSYPVQATNTKPRSYYEYAICTLCCFLPFGIMAMINATKVAPALKQENYAEAEKRSTAAKRWTLAAMVVGVILLFLIVLLVTLL